MLGPIAIIAIVVSLLLPASRHQWALSTIRQPAHYTALDFNEAWELPTASIIGRPIPISFTIANQEGQALTYTYVVRESDPLNFSQTLGTATRTVGPGRAWTVTIDVRPTCGLSPCRIQVAVPGHPEKIDFLVVLKPGQHHARKTSHRKGRHSARRA